jgi:ribose transport system substrate-binding protein
MVRVLGGKGQVAVLHGSITALNLRERLDGFREVVDQYPGIEVVGLEENGDDATLATSQAENLLTHWPKLAAFYGTSAPGAPAAVTALRERGRLGKVKVVGFDLSPENAKAIERGWITVIIEQRPYRMGELALRWLVKLHRGDKAAVSVVDTGVDVVTKDNVKALAASLK